MLRKDALVGAIVYYDGKCNQLILLLAKEAQNRNLTLRSVLSFQRAVGYGCFDVE
jgi:hypothetical protein